MCGKTGPRRATQQYFRSLMPQIGISNSGQFVKKGASGPVLKGEKSTFVRLLAWALIATIAASQGFADPDGGAFGQGEVSPLVSFLGGLHPFSVHFPVALICAAALFETIFLIGKAESAASTAFHCLALGASISILSVILGLMASESGPFIGEDAATLWTHRLFGLISCGLLLLTTYVAAHSRMQKNQNNLRILYRVLLYLTTVIVLITALFGSKLTGLAPF